ncbi:MFS transporter [Marivivens niveibacter]|nr:MFS transporter [Marivivens niveibacter]
MNKITIDANGKASVEFIALMATLTAMVAFSIDSMLPAQQIIADELSPDAPQLAQLIVTIFLLGLGIGTLLVGPISDRFGRRPVMIGGAVLYIGGAVLGYFANSMTVLLVARLIMGIGSAGPRIMVVAVVRDRFSGREMASVMSFIMMIFGVVPAIGPTVGAGLIAWGGWRFSFVAFVVFAAVGAIWAFGRLPETLAAQNRRELAARPIIVAIKEIVSNPIVMIATIIQTLVSAMLFTVLSTTQPIFETVFDKGAQFPMWFAVIAITAMAASPINARLVPRLGMRKILIAALSVQSAVTLIVAAVMMLDLPISVAFPIYLIWTIGIFFQNGFTLGNLTAIAMEPLGHIAGVAASVILAIATIASSVLAIIIGQIVGVSITTLAAMLFPLAAISLGLMFVIKR